MALEIKNLYKTYGNNLVLRDINLKLNKGEILGIIGPSGAGKSTLLKCIGGIENYNHGNVILNYKSKSKEIGFVFQDLYLWPHKTVLENITEALIHVKKIDKKEAVKIAKELLQRFNLSDKKNRYPDNLSGGEKQRVAIARALATNPKVLLLDEITSSLDPELVYELLIYIKSLTNNGISMIIVSHNLEFIRQLADKVIFIEKGTIIEEGYPDKIFSAPENARTKNFVEKIQLKTKSV